METFKIENFQADQPTRPFPDFHVVDPAQAESIRRHWVERLRCDPDIDPLMLIKHVVGISRLLEDDAMAEGFSLCTVLDREGIHATEEIFLNWDRFRTIDSLRLYDLSAFFDYIWYPSADDVEVFDATFSWMLLIHHSGQIRILFPV